MKRGTKFVCDFCGKEFSFEHEEDRHWYEVHKIVLLPVPEANLNQLYQALVTGRFEMIDEKYLLFLHRFIKNVALNNIRKGEQ